MIGYIGLGKMGLNMVKRLLEKKWVVVSYDPDKKTLKAAGSAGARTAISLSDLAAQLKKPRLIWLMAPHTTVEKILEELVPNLSKGDTLIDGGNSFYEDSIRRATALARRGIEYLDVGVSGGPNGARNGACLMMGGKRSVCTKYEKFFRDLAVPEGYLYAGASGAGHFVKMVHNGIEYAMMQALAEGFNFLKQSPFKLNLREIADLYNHGSVIESRLTWWLAVGFKKYGGELKQVSGTVETTGEGEWMVRIAKELGVPVSVIEQSLAFRNQSQQNPSYTGKILSMLRGEFGGHKV